MNLMNINCYDLSTDVSSDIKMYYQDYGPPDVVISLLFVISRSASTTDSDLSTFWFMYDYKLLIVVISKIMQRIIIIL